MSLFDLIDKVGDKIGNGIRNGTGQSDHKRLVATLKNTKEDFVQKISNALSYLNSLIEVYNKKISELNLLRTTKVKNNIILLFKFLGRYGNCKAIGDYAPEKIKLPESFPKKELENIDGYLEQVDWSEDKVFKDSFIKGPIIQTIETRKANQELLDQLNKIKLLIDHNINLIENRKNSTEIENKICEYYIDNVRFISNYIATKIIPQIELVDAIFQAMYIKDCIIAHQNIDIDNVRYNLKSIIETPYEEHFRFIRNSFMFYILSCRIYNTPVLTNLFNNQVSDNDIKQIQEEAKELNFAASIVDNSLILYNK